MPSPISGAASSFITTVHVSPALINTPDGTCVRDFVDVRDLAAAHAEVIALLDGHDARHIFNVGNGHGYSVREVIACALAVTGSDIQPDVDSPRPGDPSSVKKSALICVYPLH